jgi:outer membrane protein OmpA-like peptidoglycan-associated protein
MLLALLPAALAQAPGPTAGLAGGMQIMTETNPVLGGGQATVRVGATVVSAFDLEAEVGRLEGATRDLGFGYWTLSPRLNALVHLTPDSRADLFFTFGGGMQYVEVRRPSRADQPDERDRALYRNPSWDWVAVAGPGLTLHLAGPVHLRTDVRWYGTFGADATNARPDTFSQLEWTAGLDFRAEAPADRDQDGIPNRDDACRDEPEDRDGFEDSDGCPDGDNDGDGVMDGIDRCPDDREDRDGFQDRDGCPDPDNDQDGIADVRDSCPEDPEDRDRFQDKDGCPEPDNDDDGILDARDRCPVEAEDRDGFADRDGCPERDNDLDGFADGVDTCPDEPETANGFQDSDGCPDEVPREVKRFTGVIRGITFETRSDTIRPSSEFTLQEALSVLEEYPDVRLEVEGHTDDVGDDAFNLELSDRRAHAVVRWFVEHGVDPVRLQARGYGETRPLAENASDAGRAENRRVEFRLLQAERPPVEPEFPTPEEVRPTPVPNALGIIEVPSTPMDFDEEPTRSPDVPGKDVEPGEEDEAPPPRRRPSYP